MLTYRKIPIHTDKIISECKINWSLCRPSRKIKSSRQSDRALRYDNANKNPSPYTYLSNQSFQWTHETNARKKQVTQTLTHSVTRWWTAHLSLYYSLIQKIKSPQSKYLLGTESARKLMHPLWKYCDSWIRFWYARTLHICVLISRYQTRTGTN